MMEERMATLPEILRALREYFDGKREIVFAFLFGSAARGKVRAEGDVDIAVYFRPEEDIEWEAFEKTWEEERRMGLDLERLLQKEVDLVVLNRARAVLADEIVRKGTPIIIKDKGILMDYLCIVSDEAEYMRDLLENCYKERSVESRGQDQAHSIY
ncbi:MAG: nucleotidyltransferase domain-containing protein [Pseudomonadota bacterium]